MKWMLFSLMFFTVQFADASAPVYGYVTLGSSSSNNSVYVFDTSNNSFVTSIVTGSNTVGTNSLAITPDGTKIYVTNTGNSTVDVISTATNSITNVITTDSSPSSIAVTPDGKQVYVTCSMKVDAINTTTNAVTSINLSGTTTLAITPDSTKVYLTGPGSNISVINTSTNAISTIPIEAAASFLTITRDGSRVYVSVPGAALNTVIAISPLSNSIVASYAAGSGTQVPVVTPDGTKVYVARPGANSIAFIDTTSAASPTQIAVGTTAPNGLAMTPDGSKVFGNNTNNATNNVSSIDTSTNIATLINVGDVAGARSFDTTPDGQKVYYIAGFSTNNLLKDVNALNNMFSGSITMTSDGGFDMVFTPSSLSTVTANPVTNQFFLQADLYNSVTWTAVDRSSTRTLTGYYIYRDAALTQLAGTASSSLRLFTDHNREKGKTYSYYIVATYADGGQEVLGNTTIVD